MASLSRPSPTRLLARLLGVWGFATLGITLFLSVLVLGQWLNPERFERPVADFRTNGVLTTVTVVEKAPRAFAWSRNSIRIEYGTETGQPISTWLRVDGDVHRRTKVGDQYVRAYLPSRPFDLRSPDVIRDGSTSAPAQPITVLFSPMLLFSFLFLLRAWRQIRSATRAFEHGDRIVTNVTARRFLLRDLFRGETGQTFDPARIFWTIDGRRGRSLPDVVFHGATHLSEITVYRDPKGLRDWWEGDLLGTDRIARPDPG